MFRSRFRIFRTQKTAGNSADPTGVPEIPVAVTSAH